MKSKLKFQVPLGEAASQSYDIQLVCLDSTEITLHSSTPCSMKTLEIPDFCCPKQTVGVQSDAGAFGRKIMDALTRWNSLWCTDYCSISLTISAAASRFKCMNQRERRLKCVNSKIIIYFTCILCPVDEKWHACAQQNYDFWIPKKASQKEADLSREMNLSKPIYLGHISPQNLNTFIL